MQDTISVADCLKTMHSGAVFGCKVVSFDHNRRTGGEVLEFLEAQMVAPEEPDPTRVRRAATAQEASVSLLRRSFPNHRNWFTRNVRLCAGGTPTDIIKKIHPPLLMEFDGKVVVP